VLKRLLLKYNVSKFFKVRLADRPHSFCSTDKYESGNTICELVCVTYNNPDLIKHQVALLKKYFTGTYNLVIADNSSDRKCREKLSAFCKSEKLTYISLPHNPYTTGSQSHAASVNWVLQNYILHKQPAYFGFIDHDIFPVEPFSIDTILQKQAVYGLLQQRAQLWYLWAGFCFFNFSKFDCSKMDFMPGTVNGINLDTGGKNWDLIYSKINRDTIEFPTQTYKNLRAGDVAQSDKLEIIGNWVHSFNGSYWMKVDKKEHLLEQYLEQYK
jgi:hypothetical protein